MAPDDRAYRRGLVLGWSLAEVFVLIVFALLFAFAALAVKEQPPRTPDTGHKQALRRGNPPNDFDDKFRRLIPLTEENRRLREENHQLEKEKQKLIVHNKNLKDNVDRINLRQKQLQEWLQNQLTKSKAGGGGADYPSCWFGTTRSSPSTSLI